MISNHTVLVLSLLSVLLLFGCTGAPTPENTNPIPQGPDITPPTEVLPEIDNPPISTDPVPPEVVTRDEPEFKTADTETVIIFSRDATKPFNTQSLVGQVAEKSEFTIRGKLTEIDPDSAKETRNGARGFEFTNGVIEWSIFGEQDDGGTVCKTVVTLEGSGTTPITDLDVHYGVNDGLDSSGNLKHSPDTYGLKLKFSERDFLNGDNVLTLSGKLLFPVTVNDQVIPISPNAACDPYAGSHQEVSITEFPLILKDLSTPLPTNLEGELVARTAVENEQTGTIISGPDNAAFGSFVTNLPSVLIGGAAGPWTVSWNINLPE